ncbi:hypothetical protein Hanom_Chr03g00202021 [Helianthus anomalus]
MIPSRVIFTRSGCYISDTNFHIFWIRFQILILLNTLTNINTQVLYYLKFFYHPKWIMSFMKGTLEPIFFSSSICCMLPRVLCHLPFSNGIIWLVRCRLSY